MTTFVEIPGVGEVEFPDSMNPQQIKASIKQIMAGGSNKGGKVVAQGAIQRGADGAVAGSTPMPLPTPPPPPVSRGQAFERGARERVAGNFAALPEMLLAGSGLLSPSSGVEGMMGRPNLVPDVNVPKPSGNEALSGLMGGTHAVGNVIQGESPNLGQEFQAQMAQGQQARQEHPFMTGAGEVAGDAMSILAGRSPFTAIRGPRTAATTTDIIAPRLQRVFEKALRSESAGRLARISGRSLEGGIEGAALAIMQDGDAAETAAYAAGSQAFGMAGLKLSQVSGVTDLLSGKIIKGGAKLGATAFAVGSVIQFLKSASPGGKDYILESIEAGFDKIPLALTLGAISGMTGAGRLKGGELPIIKSDLPGVFMDAMSTLPRGATLSVLRDVLNDETGSSERAVTALVSAPTSYAKEHLEFLQDAMESGEFAKRVNARLESDESFRAVIDAPDPRLAGVPLKDE